jgi:hypothetical protein
VPSADDLANFARLRNQPTNSVIPPFPSLPDDLKKRFPSMQQWEEEVKAWAQTQLGIATQGTQ